MERCATRCSDTCRVVQGTLQTPGVKGEQRTFGVTLYRDIRYLVSSTALSRPKLSFWTIANMLLRGKTAQGQRKAAQAASRKRARAASGRRAHLVRHGRAHGAARAKPVGTHAGSVCILAATSGARRPARALRTPSGGRTCKRTHTRQHASPGTLVARLVDRRATRRKSY